VLSTYFHKGGCSECNKLDRCRSAKLIVPPSSGGQLLGYHSDRQALSIARFCHAGSLVTADTCLNFTVAYTFDMPLSICYLFTVVIPVFFKFHYCMYV